LEDFAPYLGDAHHTVTPTTNGYKLSETRNQLERYGLIWVALGQPTHDLPPFPEWEKVAYRKILCGPYRIKASGPRLVENFLDIAHFPFVHAGILGVPSHPEIADYDARIEPEGVVARGACGSTSPTPMAPASAIS
jgi:phenylpropionate dioxygenase-like ring-hydroxylating dioxygenase large terminal subunit